MAKLIPCLHCGGVGMHHDLGKAPFATHEIYCTKCGCGTMACMTPEDAVKLWNAQNEPIIHCCQCENFMEYKTPNEDFDGDCKLKVWNSTNISFWHVKKKDHCSCGVFIDPGKAAYNSIRKEIEKWPDWKKKAAAEQFGVKFEDKEYPCAGHDCYDRGNFHASCPGCPLYGKKNIEEEKG